MTGVGVGIDAIDDVGGGMSADSIRPFVNHEVRDDGEREGCLSFVSRFLFNDEIRMRFSLSTS